MSAEASRPKTGSSEASQPEASRPKGDRLQRLTKAIGRVRARAGGSDISRPLMIGGSVLMTLGLGLIGLAWYGAAHTPFLFEQVPYLISGGLLGLGLAFVGGFLYFAYWLTLLIRENRAQSRRMIDVLETIQALLAGGAAGSTTTSPRGRSANGEYVITEKGTMFHRPDCNVVAERVDLRRVSAVSNLKPCKVCDPLGVK